MNQLLDLLINLIKEEDLKTRRENWTTLFCWIDFSRTEAKHKVYNKEYQFLPLPKTFADWQKQTTEFMLKKHEEIEGLINSYAPCFQANIYPLLRKPEGDKTLLFRSKRLLENKVIGESSSLFMDLVIWEVEYRQVEGFKELVRLLNTQPMFLTDREDELFANDCEKMIEGRINYLLGQRFWLKWSSLVQKSGQQKEEWAEIGNYLKKWQAGKGAKSEWAQDLKRMGEYRDKVFELGSESISDGLPFLALGYIKEDSEEGIKVVLQNKKGFNLGNPYLYVVWFHQKVFRGYWVRGYRMLNPRSLYVEVKLEEDWVWRDYPFIMSSKGSLDSANHSVYNKRNIPDRQE